MFLSSLLEPCSSERDSLGHLMRLNSDPPRLAMEGQCGMVGGSGLEAGLLGATFPLQVSLISAAPLWRLLVASSDSGLLFCILPSLAWYFTSPDRVLLTSDSDSRSSVSYRKDCHGGCGGGCHTFAVASFPVWSKKSKCCSSCVSYTAPSKARLRAQ